MNVKEKAGRQGEPPEIPAILPLQLAGELVCLLVSAVCYQLSAISN